MHMPVGELESRMSQEEFSRWMVYFGLEPRGDERLDVNTGWLVLNMRRAMGDKESTFEDACLNFHRKPDGEVSKTSARDPKKDVNEVNIKNFLAVQTFATLFPERPKGKLQNLLDAQKT